MERSTALAGGLQAGTPPYCCPHGAAPRCQADGAEAGPGAQNGSDGCGGAERGKEPAPKPRRDPPGPRPGLADSAGAAPRPARGPPRCP